MSFPSWQGFWAMGGYALYVWASFGLTALALALTLLPPLFRHRELKRAAASLEKRQRRAAAASDHGANPP